MGSGVRRGVGREEPLGRDLGVDLRRQTEAWPSSSWTVRMSAPWSSMWVAHEWRSTCGVSRSASPARVAVLPHDAPRALPGQPAARAG